LNRKAIAQELVKVAKDLLAIGGSHHGLPGQRRGEKAHYWFVVGNVAAFKGKPASPPDFLSKECAEAYQKGYNLGLKQKKDKP
jgi:hypothetical protein